MSHHSRQATRSAQAQGLLDLAEQLQGILLPVEPSARFRRRLLAELVQESQRQEVSAAARPCLRRRGVLIGAAVGSAASVLGVIVALALRSRQRRAAHLA